MTCKDCIHCEACQSQVPRTFWDSETFCDGCKYFIDKSRFIELPCAKGDTVYEGIASNHLREGNVVGFDWGEFPDWRGCKRKSYLIVKFYGCLVHLPFERIGKTVFFTREEAEKALKERERK